MLARHDFHAVVPPDAIAEWEAVDDRGTRVRAWAGVVLVGAVITFNVALGGMKGITLVQAFQYWAKMFAISVPIWPAIAIGRVARAIWNSSCTLSTPASAAAVSGTSTTTPAPADDTM